MLRIFSQVRAELISFIAKVQNKIKNKRNNLTFYLPHEGEGKGCGKLTLLITLAAFELNALCTRRHFGVAVATCGKDFPQLGIKMGIKSLSKYGEKTGEI